MIGCLKHMFLSRIISRLMDWSNVACKHCHYSGSLEPISCFYIALMISPFSRAKTKSFLVILLASVTVGLILRTYLLLKTSVTSSFGYIQCLPLIFYSGFLGQKHYHPADCMIVEMQGSNHFLAMR